MTFAGRCASLFPALHFLALLASLWQFISNPSWFAGFIIFFSIYLFPVTVFQIHNLFFPLTDVILDISERRYNVWWTSHCLQMLFIAMPVFEGPLHLVPGLFSIWLRMWGSRIGRQVYWTPKIEVVDRGLLEVGDNVVVGHLAVFCSHAITPRAGKLSLIVQTIRIGSCSFVGAESRLGPGANLPEGELLKARTVLYWKGVLN